MMAGWGIDLGGWLWMAVWVAALLAMVWLLVGRGREREVGDDPLDILRMRLARGEISPEEYERAVGLLGIDEHGAAARQEPTSARQESAR